LVVELLLLCVWPWRDSMLWVVFVLLGHISLYVTSFPSSLSPSSFFLSTRSSWEWNLTKCCSNSSKISIYVYPINLRNISSGLPSFLKYKTWKLGTKCYFTRYGSLNQLYYEIMDWQSSDLRNSNFVLTTSPEDACLIIFPAIPNACSYQKDRYDHLESADPSRDYSIARKHVSQWFRQFPSWKYHGDGANHIIIDFYDNDDRGPWDSSGRIYNTTTHQLEWSQIYPYSTIDVGNAMVIGSNLDRRFYRPDFDIPIPLIHLPLQVDDHRRHDPNHLTLYENSGAPGFPPYVSPRVRLEDVILSNSLTKKKHLICFLGTIYQTTCCRIRNTFWKISQKINNSSVLYIPDVHSLSPSSPFNYTVYYDTLSQCVYGLVLSGKGYHSYRLVELLSLGVIPFVVRNPNYVLPFEDQWQWGKFSLVYQENEFADDNWRIITEMAKERDENVDLFQTKIADLQSSGMKVYSRFLDDKRSLWKYILKNIQQRVQNEMWRRKEMCS
jgi:hypothetical protein